MKPNDIRGNIKTKTTTITKTMNIIKYNRFCKLTLWLSIEVSDYHVCLHAKQKLKKSKKEYKLKTS